MPRHSGQPGFEDVPDRPASPPEERRRPEPDEDELYDRHIQRQLDDEAEAASRALDPATNWPFPKTTRKE